MIEFLKLAVTWVAFYILWFTAVIGAGKGSNIPAFYATAAMVALNFALYKKTWRQEIKLAVLVVLIGSLVDTIYLNLGIIHYAAPGPIAWLCPPWVSCLYLQFACTITALSQRFARYPIPLVLLSCVGGWATYRAAIAMDAADWGYTYSWIVIGIVWAGIVPLFCAISRKIYAR